MKDGLVKQKDVQIQDTITKSDLVDYAITRKVQEISEIRTEIYEEYKSYNKKRKETKEAIDVKKTALLEARIEEQFGDAIRILEENYGTEKAIISPYHKSGLPSRYRLNKQECMVIIPLSKVSERTDGHRGYVISGPGMIEDMYYHGRTTNIYVSCDGLTDDSLTGLEEKFSELDKECKRLDSKKKELDNAIHKVKSQREVVKANIVEQGLNQSEYGKDLLKTLNMIDFGINSEKLLN